ncbi:ROK family protein [Sinorhizobium sp. BG8]|uniref:ROK family transcriptional regulator n=1 Tax=Sinorhizobium sp. BG8 TaxID=2613773 RepID=UPI00193D08ED|nr:ROK family protein [Sinorhizobium sp. BG8]QRM56392.1 ROK family protein [Sinorhizobium sp. BG8]
MLTKSSTELVRQHNSALVLSSLRRHGALSHTDISEHTGLASATVSAITADLERAAIIEKKEQQSLGGRGRPRVLFAQRRDCGYLISVRIASDVVQYSLVDYAGTLIDRFEEARVQSDASTAQFVEDFRRALMRLAQRSGIEPSRVLAISISSKGLVDPSSAQLVWSPVFGGNQIDFAEVLSDQWRARVTLNNESLLVAHALAIRAEKSAETSSPSLLVLSLGHSVGLGIARKDASGELHANAPNFGHMLNSADGKLCRCGSFGCIEASAGFYGILRTAFEVPPDTIPAKFVPVAEMDKIALRARQGHRMSEYAFRQAGLVLGQGLSRVLSLYETMPIYITGPGTRYADLLSRGIEEGLRQSQQVRLLGFPQISIVSEEAMLVFEGHLDRALSELDQSIAAEKAGHAG